jgi:hypothetical protein
LDTLLAIHFPNPVVIEREVAPATVYHAKRFDWHVAVLSPMGEWYGQLIHLPQSPGMDGIFLALLQE